MNIPILLIYYNRPNMVKRQMDELKKIQPKYLYLACDGRKNAFDIEKQDQILKIINENLKWECNVSYLKSDINIGCDNWVPKAIDWFFSNVDMGIIIEDDCLIDINFYQYANYLLVKYKFNNAVMQISASELLGIKQHTSFYSNYPINWGWATWSDSWNLYEDKVIIKNYFTLFKFIFCKTKSIKQSIFWLRFFYLLSINKYTFWDAKWLYSIWKNNGVSITPSINYSKNIGFGEEATHTKMKSKFHNLEINNPSYELTSYEVYESVNNKYDNFIFNTVHCPNITNLIIKKFFKKNKNG